ncbi:MAG TPA: hypothetical protein VHI78_00975, partial [Bacteroidales bacterium]|nr:hypothetical protein [Bacteroidales bacterium]
MKILISIILTFSELYFFGQSYDGVLKKDTIIGKNLIANTGIKAVEFEFPEMVFDFYPDSTTGLLTVHLRNADKKGKWFKNTGKIVLYDPESNSIKWSKKINYLKSNIRQYNDILLQTNQAGTSRLNMATGENIWTIASQLAYIDPKTGIGIGYQLNNNVSDRLNAYDLRWGSTTWYRGIKKEFGWNDIITLNDSVILLLASGLHSIHLKYGSGWDYNTVTGSNDYTSTILLNTAGLLMAAFSGYGMIYTGYNVTTDLVSNVMMDEACLYFASRECIACLDYEGNILWKTELPKKKTSKSAIFIRDNILYMINLGLANKGNQLILFEKPYIAAFDKFSGKQILLSEIADQKEAIFDYLTGNNEIVLLYGKRIAKYSMSDGTLLFERAIPTESVGNLKRFATDELYILADSVYQTPVSYDSTSLYVVT